MCRRSTILLSAQGPYKCIRSTVLAILSGALITGEQAFILNPAVAQQGAKLSGTLQAQKTNSDKQTVKTPHATGKTMDSLVAGWLKRPELQHSLVGVEVMEVPTGRVLYSYNGDRRFITASTAKIMPTACAYETLGAAYTYKTLLKATGPVDESSLHGDLVVVPSQDPTLTRDNLRQLLYSLTDKKIKQIDGSLKLAAVPGGAHQFLNDWLPEDFGQSWMPVCSSLVIDRNVAQGVTPFKGVKVVVVPLEGEFNALTASLMNSDEAAAWISYDPVLKQLKVYCGRGTTIKSPLCVANPDQYDIGLIETMLQEMGIHLGSQPLRSAVNHVEKALKTGARMTRVVVHPATTHSGDTVLAEHQSKPLSSIIQTCLHESDNLYAQQILRTLGLLSAEESAKLTPAKASELPSIEDRGLYRLGNWMAKFGVPQQEVVLFDGCGLSRKNGVSPHALNAVLNHMAATPAVAGYLNLLKVSGAGPSGRGTFRYKTGTMDSVSSIAGVLQTAGGQSLAVTIIVNEHTPSVKRVRGLEQELISMLGTISTVSTPVEKSAGPLSDKNTAEPVEITTSAPISAPATRHSRRRRSSRHRS